MKIVKYIEFINEDFQDPPEEYIKVALMKLKKKVESFFEDAEEEVKDDIINQGGEDEDQGREEIMTFKKAMERGEKEESKKSKMSLSDFGVKLESCEVSRYSALYDSLTVKFSDPEGWYNLFLTIPLEDVVKSAKEKEEGDFSDKDVEDCSIKFKKYGMDNELIGQLGPNKYKISDIDEEFLVNLKIELDDEYGEDEEFEIET